NFSPAQPLQNSLRLPLLYPMDNRASRLVLRKPRHRRKKILRRKVRLRRQLMQISPPNPEFTWEKQNQWNIGMDLTTLQNRLNVTAEIYHELSYDLIYDSFPVPPLTGSQSLESAINIGEVENR